jgi:hypothetical protein
MSVTRLRWQTLARLRRCAAAYTEMWSSRGSLVFQGEDEVARFLGRDADELAALAVAEHNTYMELVNTLQMLGRKLVDARQTAAGLAQQVREHESGQGNQG